MEKTRTPFCPVSVTNRYLLEGSTATPTSALKPLRSVPCSDVFPIAPVLGLYASTATPVVPSVTNISLPLGAKAICDAVPPTSVTVLCCVRVPFVWSML